MAGDKVLVLDDEENLRSTLVEFLADLGYEVSCAPDSCSGVRLAAVTVRPGGGRILAARLVSHRAPASPPGSHRAHYAAIRDRPGRAPAKAFSFVVNG